jgi:hypothetical protein
MSSHGARVKSYANAGNFGEVVRREFARLDR